MDKNSNKTATDIANKSRTEFADELNNDTEKKSKPVSNPTDKR